MGLYHTYTFAAGCEASFLQRFIPQHINTVVNQTACHGTCSLPAHLYKMTQKYLYVLPLIQGYSKILIFFTCALIQGYSEIHIFYLVSCYQQKDTKEQTILTVISVPPKSSLYQENILETDTTFPSMSTLTSSPSINDSPANLNWYKTDNIDTM